MHSLDEIIKSRRFHPSIQARLESGQAADDVPGETPACRSRDEFREKLRAAVLALMDSAQLDALVYPTWSNPPRLIGDLNTPGGDNNQLFSPSTGFPAITVPMGFTRGGTLPAGLQFFGRAWSEATLLRLAYAYEQAHAPSAPAGGDAAAALTIERSPGGRRPRSVVQLSLDEKDSHRQPRRDRRAHHPRVPRAGHLAGRRLLRVRSRRRCTCATPTRPTRSVRARRARATCASTR